MNRGKDAIQIGRMSAYGSKRSSAAFVATPGLRLKAGEGLRSGFDAGEFRNAGTKAQLL